MKWMYRQSPVSQRRVNDREVFQIRIVEVSLFVFSVECGWKRGQAGHHASSHADRRGGRQIEESFRRRRGQFGKSELQQHWQLSASVSELSRGETTGGKEATL